MHNLVDAFFPLLESVMGDLYNISPPPANKTLIEHLISKIFFSANNVIILMSDPLQMVVCPYFLGQPQRISSWMQFFETVLTKPLGQELETPSDSTQQIDALDRDINWRLKGIVT